MIACRSVLIAATACLLAILSPAVQAATEVDFPDPNLRQVILDKLEKAQPPITTEDLAGLTELNATEKAICKLEGLQECVALSTLKLGKNRISDISRLAGLLRLTNLELHKNYLCDVGPLAELTNLTHLDLHRNFITDINALAELKYLEVLDVNENCIRNIGPLQALGSLKRINLYRNWIRDLSPLVECPSIYEGAVIDVNVYNNLLVRRDIGDKDVEKLEDWLGYRICEPYDPCNGDPQVIDFPVSWTKESPYTAHMPFNAEGDRGDGWSCGYVAHSMILYYWALQDAIEPKGIYWYPRRDDPNLIPEANFAEPPLRWQDMLPCIKGLSEDDPRIDRIADLAYRFAVAMRTDWWPPEYVDDQGQKRREDHKGRK